MGFGLIFVRLVLLLSLGVSLLFVLVLDLLVSISSFDTFDH